MIPQTDYAADTVVEQETLTRERRILLAEDDREMRSLLAGILEAEGYDVTRCRDGDQFVDRVVTGSGHVEFDLIISDVRMPGHSGMELLEAGSQMHEFPPMILITGFGSAEIHARARRLGAVAVFDKPFDIDALVGMVAEIFDVESPRVIVHPRSTAGGSLEVGDIPPRRDGGEREERPEATSGRVLKFPEMTDGRRRRKS